MKLTLHKSQVHSYSVMQGWACNSLMSLCLQRRVVESRERIVLQLVFIAQQYRGNKPAKVNVILR